nr:hydantoinase/oxoprolinase N-terminal domain-containing protein [Methanosarcina horonobensis]
MLIGIDVGGTTTDAVLIRNGEVYSTAKFPQSQRIFLSLCSVPLMRSAEGFHRNSSKGWCSVQP